MLRTVLFSAILGSALALLTASEAHAYGVTHTGYTSVNREGGVQHYGSTTATGAYGHTDTVSHSGSTSAYGGTAYHTGSTTASGAYGSASASTSRTYSPSAYGAYSGAGTATRTESVERYYPR